jgi:nucleoside-diphosphate-sugar epimerase
MSTPSFTVLGAGGRIGAALVAALRPTEAVQAVDRDGLAAFLASDAPAGHVISCIGLTGDFRARRLETAQAHVGLTARILAMRGFASFLYLSSTRVYAHAASTREDARLVADPTDPSDLYNLSKLTGEALCLSDPRPGVRVVRLSNVHDGEPDPDTFLGQVIQEGRNSGRVMLRQGPGSAKDYVARADVVALLPRIATTGRHRLYNLARGANVSHAANAAALRARHGWDVWFAPDAPEVTFPPIDITRLREDFAPSLSDLLPGLATMASGQEAPCSPSMKRVVA